MANAKAQFVEKEKQGTTQSFLYRLVVTKNFLSLFDQALVSGTRFLSTILVARFCGVEELGRYSLAMSLFILMFGVQQSLVFGPFTIFRNREEPHSSPNYSGNIFALFGLLSLIQAVIVIAAGIYWYQTDPTNGFMLVLLGGVTPLLLLREYTRQREFADLNLPKILLLDGITTVIQLSLLFGLILFSVLETNSALIAAAIAALIAGTTILLKDREQLRWKFDELVGEMKRHWSFGKWALAGQMTDLFTWQLLSWILLFQLGLEATGLFAACLTIVAIANPVILALNNVLAPRSAALYSKEGNQNLFALIQRTTLMMAGILCVFCLLIFLFGKMLLTFTYGSTEFSGAFFALFIISLSQLSEVTGDTVHHALRAMDRPDLSFRASLTGLIVMILSAIPMINQWGISGAAIALFAGCTTTTVLRWTTYRSLIITSTQGGEV